MRAVSEGTLFRWVKTRIRFAIVIASLVATSAFVGLHGAPAKENAKPPTVKASDLITKVQIIGDLDRPLGTLVKLRGVWREIGNSKVDNLKFELSEIDGDRLKAPIHLAVSRLHPDYETGTLTRDAKTNNWTWKAAIDVKVADECPPAISGEEWELLVFETGSVFGAPEAVRKMIPIENRMQSRATDWKFRFETRFNFLSATLLGVKTKSTVKHEW